MFLLRLAKSFLIILEGQEQLPAEIAPTVLWANNFCDEVIAKYPMTGDPIKNEVWIHNHFEAVRLKTDTISWHPAVVATFTLNFLEDLLGKINNRARTDIEVLRDSLAGISYFFHADESDQLFDEANQMTDEIYSVIGFSR